jgi:hypothetical protein
MGNWSRQPLAGHAHLSTATDIFRLVDAHTGKCLTVADPNPQVFGAIGMTPVEVSSTVKTITDGALSSSMFALLRANESIDFVVTAAVLDEFKGHTQADALANVIDTGGKLAQRPATTMLHQEHASWWRKFWNASSIDIGPAHHTLEGFYYGMQYMLGAGVAGSEVSPGLCEYHSFGNESPSVQLQAGVT